MGEVGEQGPQFHHEVGAHAKSCGVDQLFTLGALSQHSANAFQGAQHFDSMDDLQQQMNTAVKAMATVLVKGSRFMRMERVVQALQAAHPTAAALPHKEASCC